MLCFFGRHSNVIPSRWRLHIFVVDPQFHQTWVDVHRSPTLLAFVEHIPPDFEYVVNCRGPQWRCEGCWRWGYVASVTYCDRTAYDLYGGRRWCHYKSNQRKITLEFPRELPTHSGSLNREPDLPEFSSLIILTARGSLSLYLCRSFLPVDVREINMYCFNSKVSLVRKAIFPFDMPCEE